MDPAQLEKLGVLVGVIINFSLIAYCIRKLRFRRSMAPVFLTFSLASSLMSGLYWLAFDLLRAETHIPFAANVFGEIALSMFSELMTRRSEELLTFATM